MTGTSIAWGPMQGRDEIVAVLASIRRARTGRRQRHNIGSFLFEKQSATTASVRCYLDLTSTEKRNEEPPGDRWHLCRLIWSSRARHGA